MQIITVTRQDALIQIKKKKKKMLPSHSRRAVLPASLFMRLTLLRSPLTSRKPHGARLPPARLRRQARCHPSIAPVPLTVTKSSCSPQPPLPRRRRPLNAWVLRISSLHPILGEPASRPDHTSCLKRSRPLPSGSTGASCGLPEQPLVGATLPDHDACARGSIGQSCCLGG